MTDNVVEFPKKKQKPKKIKLLPSFPDLTLSHDLKRIDELENKKTLERLISAKHAIVSIMNADNTVTVIGIGDINIPKGISLCAISIDGMAKDIDPL